MSADAPSAVVDHQQSSAPFAVLVAGTAVAVVLDVTAKLVPALAPVRRWVDVGLENNLPTAWSVLLLLVLSWQLWAHRALGLQWRAAAAAALLLAVDEWVGWHEHLRVPGELLRSAGLALPTYAWVLPGVVVTALALLAGRPWILSLPPQVRRRLVLGVAVFLGGALGVESVSGLVVHLGGSVELWGLVTSVEEALEMSGVLLAISAFVGHPLAPTGQRTVDRAEREQAR